MFAFLALLLFGGDVSALGDREYRTREGAFSRLSGAGWWAVPALLSGLDSDCPERAERCHRLLCGLPRLDDYLVRLILSSDDTPPDDVLTPLRASVARVADDLMPLVVIGDKPGQTTTLSGPCERWMSQPQYFGGSEGGEVRVVLAAVRRRKE
jgi:hypothetical protein